ncbi:transglutaminase domain-containing protein [Candidatus Uhrbacteria bacterium]|nr:transglutaminase domain-containing protein [Candidatus Uhrbacteria bacterium]
MEEKKSQTEVDQRITNFLHGMRIETADDLVLLRKKIRGKLEFRPYNGETKAHADSVQWKRTASEIIGDGYVYAGRSCSDLALVYLALCKSMGIDGYLVKLRSLDHAKTHTIVEVRLGDVWYRLDPSMPDGVPFVGQLTADQVWNTKWLGGWKVWRRGHDLWEMGFGSNNESLMNELDGQ